MGKHLGTAGLIKTAQEVGGQLGLQDWMGVGLEGDIDLITIPPLFFSCGGALSLKRVGLCYGYMVHVGTVCAEYNIPFLDLCYHIPVFQPALFIIQRPEKQVIFYLIVGTTKIDPIETHHHSYRLSLPEKEIRIRYQIDIHLATHAAASLAFMTAYPG